MATGTTVSEAGGVSKGALWTGRVITILIALLLTFDVVIKFVRPIPPNVAQTLDHLGWTHGMMPFLGTILLIGLALYLIPPTAALGAILLTGYLGGAVATNLRVGDPLFNILFPIFLGTLIWLSLYLRDARLRALLPLRR